MSEIFFGCKRRDSVTLILLDYDFRVSKLFYIIVAQFFTEAGVIAVVQ